MTVYFPAGPEYRIGMDTIITTTSTSMSATNRWFRQRRVASRLDRARIWFAKKLTPPERWVMEQENPQPPPAPEAAAR